MSKKITALLAVLLLSCGSLSMTSVVQADEIDSISSGAVLDVPEGSFTIDDTQSSNDDLQSIGTQHVGGGTWNYGVSSSNGTRTCWSSYSHDYKRHKATAIMGKRQKTVVKPAGSTAAAEVQGSGSCQAYWGYA